AFPLLDIHQRQKCEGDRPKRDTPIRPNAALIRSPDHLAKFSDRERNRLAAPMAHLSTKFICGAQRVPLKKLGTKTLSPGCIPTIGIHASKAPTSISLGAVVQWVRIILTVRMMETPRHIWVRALYAVGVNRFTTRRAVRVNALRPIFWRSSLNKRLRGHYLASRPCKTRIS